MSAPSLAGELVISVLQAAWVYAIALLALPLLPSVPQAGLAYWRMVFALFCAMPLVQYAPAVSPQLINPAVFTFSATAASRIAGAAFPYGRWVAVLILAGGALRMLWLFAGCWQLRRYRRRAFPYPDPDLLAPHLQRLTAITPQIVLSGDVSVPASYGFLRPVILLPVAWLQVPENVRQAALTHEFVHLQRRDWLMHLAEEVLLAMFWFHPVLPAVIRRIRLSREQVVDRASIAITRAPHDYLRALVALAAPPPAAIPVSGFSAARQLKERIETIQKESKMSKKVRRTFLSMSVILIAGAALAIWSLPLHSAPATQSSDSPGDQVYKVGGEVTPPRILSKIEPAYTPEAKQAKLKGVVIVSLVVGKDGTPRDIQVKKKLGMGLDEKAVDAVRQWRFDPATKDGQAVSVAVTIEMQFRVL